jgi:hypothetical protein
VGRRSEVAPAIEVDARMRDQRRRSLRRKIRLQTPEMVVDTISEKQAVSLGLGTEWRKKVGH